jgi:ribosomal protein L9
LGCLFCPVQCSLKARDFERHRDVNESPGYLTGLPTYFQAHLSVGKHLNLFGEVESKKVTQEVSADNIISPTKETTEFQETGAAATLHVCN